MRFLPPICSQLKLSSVFLIKSQLSLYYVAFYEKSLQGKQSGSGFRLWTNEWKVNGEWKHFNTSLRKHTGWEVVRRIRTVQLGFVRCFPAVFLQIIIMFPSQKHLRNLNTDGAIKDQYSAMKKLQTSVQLVPEILSLVSLSHELFFPSLVLSDSSLTVCLSKYSATVSVSTDSKSTIRWNIVTMKCHFMLKWIQRKLLYLLKVWEWEQKHLNSSNWLTGNLWLQHLKTWWCFLTHTDFIIESNWVASISAPLANIHYSFRAAVLTVWRASSLTADI